MSRTKRCARTLLALAVGLALLAGCKTQAVVDVAVRPDGSGRVAVLVFLDADAAARAGDLGKVLKVSDLEARGWKVIGPGPTAQVEASVYGLGRQRDVNPSMAPPPTGTTVAPDARLRQRGAGERAAGGPRRGARSAAATCTVRAPRRSRSTKITVHGTLDFSGGLDSLADPALTSALKGRTLTQVAAELNGGTAPAPADVTFTL